jgi:hypothetical protein
LVGFQTANIDPHLRAALIASISRLQRPLMIRKTPSTLFLLHPSPIILRAVSCLLTDTDRMALDPSMIPWSFLWMEGGRKSR